MSAIVPIAGLLQSFVTIQNAPVAVQGEYWSSSR